MADARTQLENMVRNIQAKFNQHDDYSDHPLDYYDYSGSGQGHEDYLSREERRQSKIISQVFLELSKIVGQVSRYSLVNILQTI